jgi:hypothetical protein
MIGKRKGNGDTSVDSSTIGYLIELVILNETCICGFDLIEEMAPRSVTYFGVWRFLWRGLCGNQQQSLWST